MENTEPKKKRKLMPLILSTVILLVLIFGVRRYIYAVHHEVTDDAQIEGEINPVLARVTGYVNQINFEENQLVSKGDTLIIIDERELKIKLEQAEASLENAMAAIDVAEANVITARAGLNTAKSSVESARIKVWKATQDYNRYENLRKDTAITEQQYENAKAERDNAMALLNSAMSQESSGSSLITAAEKQKAVAQSMVSQKQAEVEFARLQLSYTRITAPVTGYTSRKNVQAGQLVNAGSPLLAIVSDTGTYIIANFKETQLEKMQKGQYVEIKVDAYPDTKLNGKIYAFAPATGAKFSLLPPDNATGNFVKVVQRVPVKILIDAGKEVKEKLRPGMSVKVAVSIQ
jgi:membrane fusion protein, multidrug efflux system